MLTEGLDGVMRLDIEVPTASIDQQLALIQNRFANKPVKVNLVVDGTGLDSQVDALKRLVQQHKVLEAASRSASSAAVAESKAEVAQINASIALIKQQAALDETTARQQRLNTEASTAAIQKQIAAQELLKAKADVQGIYAKNAEAASKIKIDPQVNLDNLHELNRVFQSKIDHAKELNNVKIAPKVVYEGFADAKKQLAEVEAQIKNLAKVQGQVKTEPLPAGGTTKTKTEVSFDERKISRTIENAVSQGSKRGLGAKVFDGIFLSVGQSIGSNFNKAIKQELGKDLGQFVSNVTRKSVAPIKLFITNNQELKTQVGTFSKEIEADLSGAGRALANGILAGLKLENATIKQRLNETIKQSSPGIAQSAKTTTETIKRGVPSVARSILNEQSLQPFTQAADRYFSEATERNIQKESIPRARQRAAEIAAIGKVRQGGKETGLAVDDTIEELIIAIGGYAGARGLSGKRLQSQIAKQAEANQKVIWVANTESDLAKGNLKGSANKAGALIASLATPHVQGYSQDAVEIAAQAKVALAKNPNLKIKILGESGGSYQAELAAKTLIADGHQNVEYIGVGAPNFIGAAKNAPGRKIISPDEYLGAENSKLYGKLGLSRAKGSSQQILGVQEHPFENYFEANPAELQNFLKGAPKKLDKDELGQIAEAAKAFKSIDLSTQEPKQLQQIAKSAYANLQTMRRHLLTAESHEIEELSKIAKTFESVYVAATPDPSQLKTARSIAQRGKNLAQELKSQPVLNAANIASTASKELEQVSLELDRLYSGSIGTVKKKYEQVSKELQQARQSIQNALIRPREEDLVELPVVLTKDEKQPSLFQQGLEAGKAKSAQLAIGRVNSQLARSTQKNTIDLSAKQINSLSELAPGDILHLARLGLIDISGVLGRGNSLLKGAEKGLFNAVPGLGLLKGGIQNTVLPMAAFGAASQLPGGSEVAQGLAQGLSSIAHIPLDSLAGQGASAIAELLQQSIGKLPGVGSGLVAEMAEGISAALAGGASGASGTLGSILAPILGGKLLLKAGGAATSTLLPGLNQPGNKTLEAGTEAATRLGQKALNNVKSKAQQPKTVRAGATYSALPPAEFGEILDAEIIEETMLVGAQQRALPATDFNKRIAELRANVERSTGSVKNLYAGFKKNVLNYKKGKATAGDVANQLGGFQDVLEKEIRAATDAIAELTQIKDAVPLKSKEWREANELQKKVSLRKGNLKQYATGLRNGQQSLGFPTELIKEQLDEGQQGEIVEALKSKGILKKGAIAAGAGTGALGLIATLFSGAASAATSAAPVAAGGVLAGLAPFAIPALVGGGAIASVFAARGLAKRRNAAQGSQSLEEILKELENAPDISLDEIIQGSEPRRRKGKKFGSVYSPAGIARQASNLEVDPAAAEKEVTEAVNKNGFNLPKLLGTAVGGFVALQVLPMIAQAIMGVAAQSIKNALEQERTKINIQIASESQDDAARTISSAKETAKAWANSELATQASFAKTKVAFQDTTAQGSSDVVAGGLTAFAKVKQVGREALDRGLLGATQIAQLGQVKAEEYNQLAENIPGAGIELAGASGLSVRQLRAMMKAGVGLDSADLLSRFGSRLQVSTDYDRETYVNSAPGKIDALAASFENLQTKIGQDLLAPVSTGAQVATVAINAVTNNMDLLIKTGVAGLTLLAFNILKATGALTVMGNSLKALQAGSFIGGIQAIGTGLKNIFTSGIGQSLALVAGIELLTSSYGFLVNAITGKNSLGRALEDDANKAAAAIDKITNKVSGADPEAKRKALDAKFDGDKNLADRAIDLFYDDKSPLSYVNPLAYLNRGINKENEGGRGSTGMKLDQYRNSQAVAGTTYAARIQSLGAVNIDEQRIAELTARSNLLKAQDAADRGLDPVATKQRQDEIIKVSNQKRDAELDVQKGKKALEEVIKSLKAGIEDTDTLPETLEFYKEQLSLAEAQQNRFSKALSANTIAITRTIEAVERLNVAFTRSNEAIARTTLSATTTLVANFAGSLLEGLKATRQYEIDDADIRGRRAAAATKREALEVELPAQTTNYQKLGLLPKELRTTTQEEIDRLKELGKTDPNADRAAQLVADYKAIKDLEDKLLLEQIEKISARRKVLAEENKAAVRYLQDSMNELEKSRLQTAQSSDDIRNANWSQRLKGGLQGFNSAFSQYFSSMVDILNEAAGYTTIERNRLSKQLEVDINKLQTMRSFADKGEASTYGGAGSPIEGMSAEQFKNLLESGLNPMEKTTAKRFRKRTGRWEPHGGVDIPAPAGTMAKTMFGGSATVERWEQGTGVAVVVKFVDTNGKEIVTKSGHLDEKSVKEILGISPGDKPIQVQPGQNIGRISTLPKRYYQQGVRDHLHFQYSVGGVVQQDADRFLLQQSRFAPSAKGLTPQSSASIDSQLKPNVFSAAARVIADREVQNPDSRKGYFERQNGGFFPEQEAMNGFPSTKSRLENIGRYQVNIDDYKVAQKLDPRITNFSPENQDRILLTRMKQPGLPGTDKGYTALLRFQSNPTFENFKQFRIEAGAEWESLRDGSVNYPGINRRNSKGQNINYMKKLGITDYQLYQLMLKKSGLKDPSTGDRSSRDGILLADSSLGNVASDSGVTLYADAAGGAVAEAKKESGGLSIWDQIVNTVSRNIKKGNTLAEEVEILKKYFDPSRYQSSDLQKTPVTSFGEQVKKRNQTMKKALTEARQQQQQQQQQAQQQQQQQQEQVQQQQEQITLENKRINEQAYDQEMQKFKEQSEAIDKDAELAKNTLDIKIGQQERAAARSFRKASQAERKKKRQDSDAIEDRAIKASNGGIDTPEKTSQLNRLKILREAREMTQDYGDALAEAQAEINEATTLQKELAAMAADPNTNAQQLAIIKKLQGRIKIGLQQFESTKKFNQTLYDQSKKLYEQELKNFDQITDQDQKDRLDASRRELKAASIEKLRADLAAAQQFQETSPFSTEKGDPLEIQAEIDRRALQNKRDARLIEERKKMEGTTDPAIRKNLQDTADIAAQTDEQEALNIEYNLRQKIRARNFEFQDYLENLGVEITEGQKKALEAAYALMEEKDRLAPTYQDRSVLEKAEISTVEEDARHRKELQALRQKLAKDNTYANQVINKQLVDAENKRHKDARALIAQTTANNLIEQRDRREKDALARERILIENRNEYRSAESSLLTARGESLSSQILQMNIAREQQELTRKQKQQELDDFARRNPDRKTEVIRRQQDINDLYGTIDPATGKPKTPGILERARQETFNRERYNLGFSLSQQLGSAYNDTDRAQSGLYKAKGNTYDAQELERVIAQRELALSIAQKQKEFDEQLAANSAVDKFGNYIDPEAVARITALREEFDKLSQIKLEALNQEFSRFGSMIKATTDQSGNIVAKMLGGQGTTGEDWTNLLLAPLKAFTNVISNFVNSIINKIINDLMEPVTNALGEALGGAGSARQQAGGAQSWVGQAIGFVGSLFGFADGGVFEPKHPGYGILNPHKPVSPVDNTLVYGARDGEGILKPEAVAGIGGKGAIDYMNTHYALPVFADGGVFGAGASIPMPDYNPVSTPNPATEGGGKIQLDMRFVTDGNTRFIHEDDFKKSMEMMQKQSATALKEYDQLVQDRNMHSQAYRRG